MKLHRFIITFIALFFIATLLTINAFGLEADENPDTTETINWNDLTNVKWVYEDGYYKVEFTDRQKELDGKELIIEGFMFPLEFTRKHRNFMVSASPMGDCFFCGPGEAESMVFVKTIEGVEYSYQPMKVTGTFKLIADASQGIIYQLDDARVVQ